MKVTFFVLLFALASRAVAQTPTDGSVLPFPPEPMKSVVKPRLQDSTMKWPEAPQRLKADAPNILIILLDDTGFGVSEVFGGEVETPAFKKLAAEGLRYNMFHTTSICSPTRASLLTGRNHTRVGYGTIAERAVAFDGFTGIMPKEAATAAEVLRHYGYRTAAFGKWHNTPATETTSIRPFDRWPTGYGFDTFWGFIAGETSQWEPRLTHNTLHIEPPHEEGYHLTEGMADEALKWLDDYQAYSPDTPFFMYWAPGAVHGPHHVAAEWSDKYKGKFDDGWDAYRQRTYKRQLEMGVIPEGTQLTERNASMQGWDDIPEAQRPFQRRLMEVYAGFTEHADAQVGRIIEELERQDRLDNTLVFYIWGDNGSSSEGLYGTISEQLAQNGIPTTISQHLAALEELGGLDAIGGHKTDNMYHAGWAWAGSTPFQGTKLQGAYFGGTRQPMAVAWPKKIKPDRRPRSQFHHVIDVVPTVYELLNIPAPTVVNGFTQDAFDGTSMTYTFDNADSDGTRKTQFFDIMASRGVDQNGWFASARGPREPWVGGVPPGIREWSPLTDTWQLYHIEKDFSQADDLADKHPEKLDEMKALFLTESAKNKNLPIGGGLWSTVLYHPEDAPAPPYTEWTFYGPVSGTPESAAPKLGKVSSRVAMEVETTDKCSGVLYALAGFSGGLTCYMNQGTLCYEFNLFEIERTKIQSKDRLAAGKHKIEVLSRLVDKIGGPINVTLMVDGTEVASGRVPRGMSLHFTSNATFDVGRDQDSPVSLDYFDRAPFAFEGQLGKLSSSIRVSAAT